MLPLCFGMWYFVDMFAVQVLLWKITYNSFKSRAQCISVQRTRSFSLQHLLTLQLVYVWNHEFISTFSRLTQLTLLLETMHTFIVAARCITSTIAFIYCCSVMIIMIIIIIIVIGRLWTECWKQQLFPPSNVSNMSCWNSLGSRPISSEMLSG